MTEAPAAQTPSHEPYDKVLFWGCFIALVATAFAFVVRGMLLNTFGHEFGLTKTELGEIQGVGLWPFAISIVLFSLVIDHIGYRKAMIFAFVCHTTSAILTIFATGYWSLWTATFIVALGNGTVEAFINPVVATMFRRDKTKWLNILHAGWPGGMVLGGMLALVIAQTEIRGTLGVFTNWQVMVALLLIPTAVYAVMLWRCRFPVQERVAAGVSYRDMLAVPGGLGMLIVTLLVFQELCRVLGVDGGVGIGLAVITSIGFGLYTHSLGRPMFIFLLLLMAPLATTELGVDSWITPLMEGQIQNPVLVLLYTAFIMMVLRLFAGPVVHRLSPLGLLAVSAAVATVGLLALSAATGFMIFAAATLYGIGKTFFWPTMLGIVSERFPKGGALTLNATGAVGMLSVGIVGSVFLGLIQDKATVAELDAKRPELVAVVTSEKTSVLGDYVAVDPDKLAALPETDQVTIQTIETDAQKGALSTVAIFPLIMLVCYLALIVYFKRQGGYRPVQLE